VWASVLLFCSTTAGAIELRAFNSLWESVLKAHVKDGYVDYPAVSRNVRFHKYVEALGAVDLATLADGDETTAFWINAYNAMAVKSVVDGITPIDAIDRIKFFRTTEHLVAGRELDLNAIEAEAMSCEDPRVRFALVNAAYTAPALHQQAYDGATLDQQLDSAAKRFINDNRRNRYSDAVRVARLSKLFERHADEFGEDEKAIMAFIAPYVEDETNAKALAAGRYEVRYMDWEWSINGRPM